MIKVTFKDGYIETFEDAVCWTERLGKIFLWENVPIHPELTVSDEILDTLESDSVAQIERV